MRIVAAVVLAVALASSAQAQVNEGDSVVVRHDGSWFSAEVAAVDGGKVKVRTSTDPPTELEVGEADVAVQPTGEEKLKARPGDWVLGGYLGICWLPRKMKVVADELVTVVNFKGEDEELNAAFVMAAPEAWKDALAKQFEKCGHLAGIAATKPPRGTGTAVKPGDRVIFAKEDPPESWYEGEVLSAGDGSYKVADSAEEAKKEEAVDVKAALVAPVPSDEAVLPAKVGDAVYWRLLHFAYYTPWVAGRVDGVCGNAVCITLATGETQIAFPGEWVPQGK